MKLKNEKVIPLKKFQKKLFKTPGNIETHVTQNEIYFTENIDKTSFFNLDELFKK